jgi:hypothetical protein
MLEVSTGTSVQVIRLLKRGLSTAWSPNFEGMDTRAIRIEEGSKVVDPDGKSIGEVKGVREDHVIVGTGTLVKKDLYVPIDQLASGGDGTVTIGVPANEVDQQGWQYPPNAGFERERPAVPEVPETTTIQTAGYSAGRLSAPEPQGAVRDDQTIDPAEVPNEDVGESDRAPGTLEESDRT